MAKNILIISSIFLLIGLCGCDPFGEMYEEIDTVKLTGDLNRTDKTLKVGDTLSFRLQVPAELIGSNSQVIVKSLQEGYYNFQLSKIDTVNKISDLVLPNSNDKAIIFTTIGSINTIQSFFDKTVQPYTVTLNIIPKQAGIYYLEILQQAGKIKVNGNYTAGLLVNFNVSDKHFDLIAKYNKTPAERMNLLIQKDAEGFGTYGFEVR